jgi:hypothetical protein
MGIDQKTKHRKRFFSAFDDNTLCLIKDAYPSSSWREIASFMPGFTARQLRERWSNYLCPTLNASYWTDADDLKLMDLHQTIGSRWATIGKCMGNRSAPEVKNRFRNIQNRSGGSEEKAEWQTSFTTPPELMHFRMTSKKGETDRITRSTPMELSIQGILI